MNKFLVAAVLSMLPFVPAKVENKIVVKKPSKQQIFSDNTLEKMVFPTVIVKKKSGAFGPATKGSGVIFSNKGKTYVLTARHCVITPSRFQNFVDGKIKIPNDLATATVVLGNLTQTFKLAVKYIDAQSDFAILSIKSPPATKIGLGKKFDFNLKLRKAKLCTNKGFDQLYLTDKIYCVGFPGPLSFQVIEAGTISFVNPSENTFGITSPVVPGNSGGPVFNSKMEVIGVVSFIYKLRNGQLITHLCNVVPITKVLETLDAIE